MGGNMPQGGMTQDGGMDGGQGMGDMPMDGGDDGSMVDMGDDAQNANENPFADQEPMGDEPSEDGDTIDIDGLTKAQSKLNVKQNQVGRDMVKIDVFEQLMMNIDILVDILYDEFLMKDKK